MNFIVLLFTVLLQKQTRKPGYQRDNAWFRRLSGPFNVPNMGFKGQFLVYCLIVLLPCLLLGVFMASLSGLLGGALSLLIQVAGLLYVLGRDDFSQRVELFNECWRKEDYQGAFCCAQSFLSLRRQVECQSPFELHQAVRQAIIHAWFVRFFVFVFWFLLLGIGGALACLLSFWFFRQFKLPWVKSLLGAIEWLPARLLALSMALAGDFVRSFPQALAFASDFHSSSKRVLTQTALSADQQEEAGFDCQAAQQILVDTNQLMLRCGILWLLAVACLTVFAGF
ncbi:MAG: regulatory signaling modulator protein AmpE [Bermanella sp.]